MLFCVVLKMRGAWESRPAEGVSVRESGGKEECAGGKENGKTLNHGLTFGSNEPTLSINCMKRQAGIKN